MTIISKKKRITVYLGTVISIQAWGNYQRKDLRRLTKIEGRSKVNDISFSLKYFSKKCLIFK